MFLYCDVIMLIKKGHLNPRAKFEPHKEQKEDTYNLKKHCDIIHN